MSLGGLCLEGTFVRRGLMSRGELMSDGAFVSDSYLLHDKSVRCYQQEQNDKVSRNRIMYCS